MPTFVTVSSGTAARFEDTGELTLPLQSSFLAYIPSTVNNVTGAATLFTLGTSTAFTELFDRNSDFNTNGTFTAPVTGIYCFHLNVTMTGIGILMTSAFVRITTTARSYLGNYLNPNALLSGVGNVTLTLSTLADMTANDTATFAVSVSGDVSNTADVLGSASPYSTYVSGYLVA